MKKCILAASRVFAAQAAWPGTVLVHNPEGQPLGQVMVTWTPAATADLCGCGCGDYLYAFAQSQ